MAEFIRAQVRFTRDTGVEADVITNTWHFDAGSGTLSAAVADVHTALTSFYNAIDVYMPTNQIGTTAEVRYYDMSDAEPRVPVDTETIALSTTAGESLPAECAIAMSFQGATGSGVNMRRRRGRLYLGPVVLSAATTLSGRVAVASAARSAIATAAQAVKNYAGSTDLAWAIFSPTTLAETSDLDQAFEDVVSGWIDDEFDIQRRRGTIATTRTTWS